MDFHLTQPLFASGGDDFKIKVWNYKQRKCLFTLGDHLDYIRTVQFHHEYPWIVSASDDQTIRIWNWQNRQCITTLTGHNHYVMSARFHPKEDLVVSASLDQTVRVWDIGPLRAQQLAAPARPVEESAAAASLRLAQAELFGVSPATLKYPPLEGHERGVNWAAFHPTLPLIVSSADDRVIKLWRMNESKAWEVDTLRGHFNNVSCVLFHPRSDLIVSNSEDKTIRVWDMAKRTCLYTYRREYDRFWILAAHPEQNVFAAGHDTGVMVFKLERERPPFTVYRGKHQSVLLYIKDRHLRSYELETGKDAPIMSLRKPSTTWKPVALSYAPSENAVLVTSQSEEGSSYELYRLPVPGSAEASSDNAPQSKRGLGSDAVFFARNKFATFERGGHVVVRGLDNEVVRRLSGPAGVTGVFAATSGRLLLRTDEGALLVDPSRGSDEPLARVPVPHLKYVVWAKNTVGLLGKHTVVLCTRELQVLCTVQESSKVKSGAWDANGMFLYSTVNHIKYLLPNGDSGIIRTIDVPVYLTGVRGNKVYCLDREAKTKVLSIDITESYFKMALYSNAYDTILRMVREANLIGNSIVGYLQRKGYPDIALHFVKDPLVRFNLALECSAMETALQAARQLELPDCWRRLAQAALSVGDYATAELGFSRCGDTAALSMLYVCSGRMDALKKLGAAAHAKGDVMASFHAQLLGGTMEGVLGLVERAGHTGLAALGRSLHGFPAPATEGDEAAAAAAAAAPPAAVAARAVLLRPPTCVFPPGLDERTMWPRLAARPSSVLDAALADAGRVAPAVAYAVEDVGTGDIGDWGGDDLQLPGGGGDGGGLGLPLDDGSAPAMPADEGGGWADLELPPLDLGGDAGPAAAASGSGADYFVPVGPGESRPRMWTRSSRLVCDSACAGDWQAMAELLRDQVGVAHIGPLKAMALDLYRSCRVPVDGLVGTPALVTHLLRSEGGTKDSPPLPLVSVGLAQLVATLQEAYASMSAGKFSAARAQFLACLHGVLFLAVDTRDAESEAKELVSICREYLIGITLEMKRKDEKDGKRAADLAAYFTNCKLQTKHALLVIRTAMKACIDIKNYQSASGFARRLLDLAPSGPLADQAKQVVQFADRNPSDAVRLDYDERNPFSVCCIDLVPIYKGQEAVHCAFCGASYKPAHTGKDCTVCTVGRVGSKGTGLHVLSFNKYYKQ